MFTDYFPDTILLSNPAWLRSKFQAPGTCKSKRSRAFWTRGHTHSITTAVGSSTLPCGPEGMWAGDNTKAPQAANCRVRQRIERLGSMPISPSTAQSTPAWSFLIFDPIRRIQRWAGTPNRHQKSPSMSGWLNLLLPVGLRTQAPWVCLQIAA